MAWTARLAVLAAALWWGSLTAIGFMAVPLLFRNASTPAVAGQLAAKLFSAQSWLGLACGAVLLMGARRGDGTPHLDWARGALPYLLFGMLAGLLQEFAIAPRIVMRENLAVWHTVGTALYAAQWLCALVVLWRTTTGHPREGGGPGLER
jgi:Domain of unknown function (DUF4149)